MKQYLAEREKREKTSRVAGVALTVVLHCILFGCCFLMGFSYLYPPPPEKEQILIDFSEFEVETPRQTLDGSRPSAVRPRPEEDINLVQKSEAQNVGTESNEAPEATGDEFGDVDIVEPPREKEIDRRALFHAADNKTEKDTLAQQTAVIMLDEPTAYLDYPSKVHLMRLLVRVARNEKKGVIVSTHDVDIALRMADRIWLMNGGKLMTGTVDELSQSGALNTFLDDEGVVYNIKEKRIEIKQENEIRF